MACLYQKSFSLPKLRGDEQLGACICWEQSSVLSLIAGHEGLTEAALSLDPLEPSNCWSLHQNVFHLHFGLLLFTTGSNFKARNGPTCSGWGGSRAGIDQRLQCIMVTITKKILLINSPPIMGLICNSIRVCQPVFTNLYWLVFAYFQKLFQLLSCMTVSHLQHLSGSRVLRREGFQGFVCFLKLST